MDPLDQIAASGGTTLYDDTAEKTGFFISIYVREDTVISTLEEKDSPGDTATDATVAAQQNISGKTLVKGDLLTPRKDYFSKIAISSGSVLLIKGQR